MNSFFKVRVAPAAVVERLTAATAPTLVCTHVNPVMTMLAPLANVREMVEGSRRRVVNDRNAAMAGSLFIALVTHRHRHFEAFYDARKRATGHCDHMAMLIGNAVPTAQCEWEAKHPERCTLATSTVEEEMIVVGWAWAMYLLRDALTAVTEDGDDGGDAEAAEELAKKAAAVLGLLRLRAPAENTALFNRHAPMFCKEYVWRAYQALAVAAVHVARANKIIAISRDDEFRPVVASLLVEAAQTLEVGLGVLKDESGADDVGITVPRDYHRVATAVYAASRFYVARMHAAPPSPIRLVFDHMKAAAALDACSEMQAGMQEMLEAVATMQENMALNSAVRSFFGAIFTSRAVNENDQITLLNALRALPALDPPPEAPVFTPVPPETLLFRKLLNVQAPAQAPPNTSTFNITTPSKTK